MLRSGLSTKRKQLRYCATWPSARFKECTTWFNSSDIHLPAKLHAEEVCARASVYVYVMYMYMYIILYVYISYHFRVRQYLP